MRPKSSFLILIVVMVFTGIPLFSEDSNLTIYNQNFAVIRESLKLSLKKGLNTIRHSNTTAHLEPDSVVLRDPAGKHRIDILEQNFRAAPVTQELLLSLYEGKTIDFLTIKKDSTDIISGKIVRSGYVPHYSAMQRYGPQYQMAQMTMVQGSGQPIIEVDGKLRFSLPGQPLFPPLSDDALLKPALEWVIGSDQAVSLDAELGYISGGLSWHADYNIVSPTQGESADVIGWVTIDNNSGKSFERARTQLMAGDVSKIAQSPSPASGRSSGSELGFKGPRSTEIPFDEYHLYSLHRPLDIRDREMKQVEFIRAQGVKAQKVFIYDGSSRDNRFQGYPPEHIRSNREYGTQSNPKVWVMRTIQNTKSNQLGMPLPKGRTRFYQKGDNGQLEFVGEDTIDHTPAEETLRVFTGNAFDLIGERRQTQYNLNSSNNALNESFEINIRNHKKERVEVRIIEHLYRWHTWEIVQHSHPYEKIDSRTIEFRVDVPPGEEKVVTYFVYYSW